MQYNFNQVCRALILSSKFKDVIFLYNANGLTVHAPNKYLRNVTLNLIEIRPTRGSPNPS